MVSVIFTVETPNLLSYRIILDGPQRRNEFFGRGKGSAKPHYKSTHKARGHTDARGRVGLRFADRGPGAHCAGAGRAEKAGSEDGRRASGFKRVLEGHERHGAG